MTRHTIDIVIDQYITRKESHVKHIRNNDTLSIKQWAHRMRMLSVKQRVHCRWNNRNNAHYLSNNERIHKTIKTVIVGDTLISIANAYAHDHERNKSKRGALFVKQWVYYMQNTIGTVVQRWIFVKQWICNTKKDDGNNECTFWHKLYMISLHFEQFIWCFVLVFCFFLVSVCIYFNETVCFINVSYFISYCFISFHILDLKETMHCLSVSPSAILSATLSP